MRAPTVFLLHGKTKKKVDVASGTSFEDFQGQVFSVVMVPPDRQTLLVKGKSLTCDDDMKLLKKKTKVTVLGSAVEMDAIEQAEFIEDKPPEERAIHEVPPGLYNLGNTCYLNSCLQCIKGITELKEVLKKLSDQPLPATRSW